MADNAKHRQGAAALLRYLPRLCKRTLSLPWSYLKIVCDVFVPATKLRKEVRAMAEDEPKQMQHSG